MADSLVSYRIAKPVADELERLSSETGVDSSVLAEEAIAEYVDRRKAETEAIEAAVLAAEYGEFISHEAMKTWLLSWGTENELPPPEPDIFKARGTQP